MSREIKSARRWGGSQPVICPDYPASSGPKLNIWSETTKTESSWRDIKKKGLYQQTFQCMRLKKGANNCWGCQLVKVGWQMWTSRTFRLVLLTQKPKYTQQTFWGETSMRWLVHQERTPLMWLPASVSQHRQTGFHREHGRVQRLKPATFETANEPQTVAKELF